MINICEYGVPNSGVWLLRTMEILFWVYVGISAIASAGMYLILWSTLYASPLTASSCKSLTRFLPQSLPSTYDDSNMGLPSLPSPPHRTPRRQPHRGGRRLRPPALPQHARRCLWRRHHARHGLSHCLYDFCCVYI